MVGDERKRRASERKKRGRTKARNGKRIAVITVEPAVKYSFV